MPLDPSSPMPPAWARTSLANGAYFDYAADWLAPGAASELEHALAEQLSFEQRAIELFGKRVVQPRLIAWAGALPYRYSGQTLESREFPPALAALCDAVRQRCGLDHNHALVNYYRDGNDCMGWHSDAEPELGPNPIITSLSLGATRRFVISHKRNRHDRHEIDLAHGSLLIMGGTMQHHYRHGLPRSTKQIGRRINVTFRQLCASPKARSGASPAGRGRARSSPAPL